MARSTPQDSDFSFNGIFATPSLTASDNTISVQGMDHELDLDDVNVSGSLTTDVEGFSLFPEAPPP